MAARNLLVLGGTGWVGRHAAEMAAQQGVEVTCLARGSAAAARAGTRFVGADRTVPGAYDELADRDWDEVIDVTWQPGQARTAVAALGYRAAIGGIIALALVSQYFVIASLSPDGIALVVLQAGAVVALEVTGALLSLRPRPGSGRVGGGPVSGAIFAAVGFFLLGLGPIGGEVGAFGGALVALAGAAWTYRRLRPLLAAIPPPSRGPPPVPPGGGPPTYGRTDGARADRPLPRGGRSEPPPAG